MPNLYRLDLKSNDIGPGGAWMLASGISARAERYEVLTLRNNAIGRQGAEALARAFRGKKNIRMRKFILSNNGIGPMGADSLASVIQNMSDLEELDLNNNQIEMRGGMSLAWALPLLPKLEILRLDDNLMGPKAAVTLVKALRRLNSLQVLTLQGNCFGTEAAIAIVEAFVQRGKGLRVLSMKYNDINQKVMGPHLRDFRELCWGRPVPPHRRRRMYHETGFRPQPSRYKPKDDVRPNIYADLHFGRWER
eukprot:Nitzschia sp. Nitz4//scaffold37_size175936//35112//35861//NITZ4_002029-RA/size175936-processed-gene-0.175-mRNA-1//1//CDS//3329549737//9363//frame0